MRTRRIPVIQITSVVVPPKFFVPQMTSVLECCIQFLYYYDKLHFQQPQHLLVLLLLLLLLAPQCVGVFSAHDILDDGDDILRLHREREREREREGDREMRCEAKRSDAV